MSHRRGPAERQRESLDIFIGFLGFVTALLFVSTAYSELRGRASLAQAVALGVLVVLVWITLRMRRRLSPPSTPRGPGQGQALRR